MAARATTITTINGAWVALTQAGATALTMQPKKDGVLFLHATSGASPTDVLAAASIIGLEWSKDRGHLSLNVATAFPGVATPVVWVYSTRAVPITVYHN
jgi:ribonuclease PH